MNIRGIAMKRTNKTLWSISVIAGAALAMFSVAATAFNSGSTGTDGAFSPSENVTVQVPSSGILNYTTVNIPAGVTVTFQNNASNTPVIVLASGNVTISGTIDVSAPAPLSNDQPDAGLGGPGGFNGGTGGVWGSGARRGGNGLGPGGGGGGDTSESSGAGGGGAGYGTGGDGGRDQFPNGGVPATVGDGGAAYGSIYLQPLIGGSGGGGGAGSTSAAGTGGGGGGGAILIASSGTLTLDGAVLANGTRGSFSGGGGYKGCGGAGSGGAIRLVASQVTGSGYMTAAGGSNSGYPTCYDRQTNAGGDGGKGRIRVEGDQITLAPSGSNNPTPSLDVPGPVFVTGQPSLVISSVAGVAAPASPTGNMDVTLPATTTNPVTVVFTTSGVPVGSTINLNVKPTYAAPITATSGATTGTTASATASASVSLPTGHNVLQATVSYTLVASVGDALRNFANNERVESVTLVATFGGPTKARLRTISGKEYDVPVEALRLAAAGG